MVDFLFHQTGSSLCWTASLIKLGLSQSRLRTPQVRLPLSSHRGLPGVSYLSHQTRGFPYGRLPLPSYRDSLRPRLGYFCFYPSQAYAADPFSHALPSSGSPDSPGSPGHAMHLIGEQSVPLMLLGSGAVHPLEGGILDEDGQGSEDEGRKQVQVDVVPGAVQVSEGESRALPWHDGQCWLPASPHTRQARVSLSGTMFTTSFLRECLSSSQPLKSPEALPKRPSARQSPPVSYPSSVLAAEPSLIQLQGTKARSVPDQSSQWGL